MEATPAPENTTRTGTIVLGLAPFDEQSSVAAVRARAEAYLAQRAAETVPPPDPDAKLPSVPRDPANTHVYVVEVNHATKVGFAANLYVRVSNLRTDSPFPVTVVAYYELPKEMGKDVERFVHMALDDSHIRGEWFDVPAAEAKAQVERVIWLVRELYFPTREDAL